MTKDQTKDNFTDAVLNRNSAMIPVYIYDDEPLYKYVTTDGAAFYSEGKKITEIYDYRIALVFELERIYRHIA